MDDRRLELRVAVLALAALAGGAGLLFLIGAFDRSGDAHLRVDFAHSGGVPTGAPVKVAGVAVGRVQALVLDPERRDDKGRALPVQLQLSLARSVLGKLHAGVRVGVATQGPLGEPFVEIDPGPVSGPALPENAELRGDDPPRLDQLIAQMEELVGAVHELITSPDGGAGDFLRDAANLTRDADGALRDNREALTATLKDVRDAAGDLRAMAKDGRALLAEGKVQSLVDDGAVVARSLRENVPDLARDARHLARSGDNLAGSFTPEDGARLKAAMARYEAAGEKLQTISEKAERIITAIDAGKGNAGAMIKDDQLYRDLKDLVADLKAHPWKVLWKQ
jgi:phospholipid/cholesterol/gamma-HCH transport system substrate-binding protein